MSNLEFIWILIQAFWPFTLIVGIIWVIIIIDAVVGRKKRKKCVLHMRVLRR